MDWAEIMKCFLPSYVLLRDLRPFETEVSRLHNGPIIKGLARHLKMKPTDGPETSVSKQLMPHNKQKDRRICFMFGESA